MLADATHSTFRLLSGGPVPLWAGALVLFAASAFVIRQLHRDLAGIRSTRLTRWVLPSIRLAIVALFVWLLCQPVLLIVRRWTPPPEVLLVIDSGNSMRVNEGAGDISRSLDALDSVGKQPIARRNNAASRIARAAEGIGQAVSSAVAGLQEERDAAGTGMPLGPSVGRKTEALAALLHEHGEALALARAQLPTEVGDKELKKLIADLAAASQVVGAAIEGIVADAVVVGKEASKTPSLLDAYTRRLKTIAGDVDSLRKRSAELQQKLDGVMLKAEDIEKIRAHPLTRESLAELAADRLATESSSGHATHSAGSEQPPAWTRQRSSSLATTLEDAFHKTLASPLAAVVLLSDGSSPIPFANGTAGASLAQLRLPVNTILIGADGEEPADAGLICVDVPRVVLAGDVVNVRCLVKNLIASGAPPKLTLTIGKEKIATRDLPVTHDGPSVVEFSWTPTAPGRLQLVFRVETAQSDAYPGNESSARIVDVVTNKAHVLIVSDRLTGDFAAISQLLANMPAVDARTILAAPGLSKFHTGSKSDEFPASADDFKALSLLVLIGDMPEAAGGDVLQSLKQAIDAGLRVWVQAPAAGRSQRPWTAALGIETRPISGRQAVQPAPDLWLDLYDLGQGADESAERWKELPPVSGLNEIVTAGVGLLTSGGRPVMQLIPRKAGALVATGISNFTAMRSPSSATSVNRMLAESLSLALRPIAEPGMKDGIFPPQPVFDHSALLIGNATSSKALDAASGAPIGLDGAKAFRVSDPQAIAVQAGGAAIERVVRHLMTRQDFQLAAHDAPLEKIAKETGGRHRDLHSMMDILPPGLAGTPHISSTRLRLWPGPWSLIAILLLVSAEYLLRRRAGKVM